MCGRWKQLLAFIEVVPSRSNRLQLLPALLSFPSGLDCASSPKAVLSFLARYRSAHTNSVFWTASAREIRYCILWNARGTYPIAVDDHWTERVQLDYIVLANIHSLHRLRPSFCRMARRFAEVNS